MSGRIVSTHDILMRTESCTTVPPAWSAATHNSLQSNIYHLLWYNSHPCPIWCSRMASTRLMFIVLVQNPAAWTGGRPRGGQPLTAQAPSPACAPPAAPPCPSPARQHHHLATDANGTCPAAAAPAPLTAKTEPSAEPHAPHRVTLPMDCGASTIAHCMPTTASGKRRAHMQK